VHDDDIVVAQPALRAIGVAPSRCSDMLSAVTPDRFAVETIVDVLGKREEIRQPSMTSTPS